MAQLGKLKAKVEQEDQARAVEIFERDGKPVLAADGSRATITVIGSESREYKSRLQKATRKWGRNGGTDEELAIASAAAGVVDWHGWEDEAGAAIPCTPENVKALLSLGFIRAQVQTAINRTTDFFAEES